MISLGGASVKNRHRRKFRYKPIRAGLTRGNGLGGLIPCVARLKDNASRARLLFKSQPNGILNGKPLRVG